MAETTNIEWCDATLNLWWGCTKVSDGCKFCYAEELSDQRFGGDAWGPKGKRREVKSWRSTLNKISSQAKREGRRLRVFCQSMSDTFEGPETMGGGRSSNSGIVESLRLELFAAIEEHRELDFLLLTKRPENVLKHVKEAFDWITPACYAPDSIQYPHLLSTFLDDWLRGKAPSNLWIGTSVENQEEADKRIPELLKIPAAVRFLSCEPLLGPVDLDHIRLVDHADGSSTWTQCLGDNAAEAKCSENGEAFVELPPVHWVIVGGESGKDARPMNPEWARSLRDQCVAAGVPFFFKQWGEWLPWNHFLDSGIEDHPEQTRFQTIKWENGAPRDVGRPDWSDTFDGNIDDELCMGRVGKKAAGRLLDSRTWDEFPEISR